MITLDELATYVVALKLADSSDFHMIRKSLTPFEEAGVILAIPESKWDSWEEESGET